MSNVPIDYITGSEGFVGTKLLSCLPGKTVKIPHAQILDWEFRDHRHFYFLATYGNLVGQNDIAEVLLANVAKVGGVLSDLIDKKFMCESFVFVSSSSVTLPVQTPYSRAKRAAEEMILASGISAAIVRPFSITGRGEQRQHLIPTLIRSCFEGTPMNLVADATHDYVDVSDVCNGLIALANSKAQGVFEFGTGLSWSNGDVLNLVEEVTGKKANVNIITDQLRPYDNTDWKCRDFSARQFGWKPEKTLSHSVCEMVEAYRHEH